MAKRFVRIDLSDAARDFLPIAIEPGVPLLDPSNTNNRILFRWLGRMAAEPVWNGKSVDFFVRDDQGGRLEEVVCQPVVASDLNGSLKTELTLLQNRIDKVKPETATERALHNCLKRSLKDLFDDNNRTDHDCYFFRYRDAGNRWRLVWCWGFQRRDREPGTATICTDPECSLLFVRLPGRSQRCPSCEAAAPQRPKRKSRGRVFAALALLILATGLGWFLYHGLFPVSRDVPVADKPALKPAIVELGKNLHARPKSVKLSSVQGSLVQMPVGAEFADFSVEATYDDGSVRNVTKEATLTTADEAQKSPVAISNGRLMGIHPGRTTVKAECNGVAADQSLAVEVTAKPEIDEIQLTPNPAVVSQNDTIAFSAIGYKNGKSVGDISRRGDLVWQADKPDLLKLSGCRATGVSLGQGVVTVKYDTIVSKPAPINVVEATADPLVVKPEGVCLRVGESVRFGADVVVLQGETDVSDRAVAAPAVQEIVRYLPESKSLVGVAPGKSSAAVTVGSRMIDLPIIVLPPAMPKQLEGAKVLVEPSTVSLAPGQAMPLRVFLVASNGERIDRTASAVLSSSNGSVAKTSGDQVLAVASGEAQISATLPDVDRPGSAAVTVSRSEIIALSADPQQLQLAVGDRQDIRVFGATADGARVLFPQEDLKWTLKGNNSETVLLGKSGDISGVNPGEATVTVSWRDKLRLEVPVRVVEALLNELRIEPAEASITAGQQVAYRVSALQAGQRRVLGPDDGVQLSLSPQPEEETAAIVGPMMVQGRTPGHTVVFAEVAGQHVQGQLAVLEKTSQTTSDVVAESETAVDTNRLHIYDSDTEYVYGGNGDIIGDSVADGAGRAAGSGTSGTSIAKQGKQVSEGKEVSKGPSEATKESRGQATDKSHGGKRTRTAKKKDKDAATDDKPIGLRFIPDKVQLSSDGPPANNVRVVEVLTHGHQGRDVTDDPSLEIRLVGDSVQVEKSSDGLSVRPVKDGMTHVRAKLDSLKTTRPFLAAVGKVSDDLAKIVVSPRPLTLWAGETGGFSSVRIDPGSGREPFSFDYLLKAIPCQNNPAVVEVVGGKKLRALGAGTARVTVSHADPQSRYKNLSAVAIVRVVAAQRLAIEPSQVHLDVGRPTPRFRVTAYGADGVSRQVDAKLQTMSPAVLAPDPTASDRFIAKSLGATQVRAVFHNREATAAVDVSGKRFNVVTIELNSGNTDFAVAIKVTAAESEGPLEYRVYAAGESPAGKWIPAQKANGSLQVDLHSPRMAYRSHDSQYQLIVEARNRGDNSIQTYPLNFQLKSMLEEVKK